MQHDKSLLKIVNTIYFTAIVFLAIYFGKERAIFCDGSNALYDIVTRNMLYYDSFRIATIPNYLLPLIALKFGFSLKVIVYALVLNYLLLPVLTFVFLRYKQTTLKYELAFLVSFSLFNWQTYYYPIHDYWTGFYLFFILYRLMDDEMMFANKKRIRRWVMFLILLIFFSHINMLLSLGFLIGYLFSEKRITRTEAFQYFGVLAAGLVFKVLFFSDGYETGFLTLSNFSPYFLATIPFSDLFTTLLPTFLNTNINFLLLVVLFYFICIIKRRWTPMFMFTGILFSAFAVLLILFKDYEYTVYAEGQIKSATIVLGIMFVSMLVQSCQTDIKVSALIALSYIFSCIVLFHGGEKFERHYEFINKTCKQYAENIYLVSSNKNLCPLELVVLPKHSLIINQIENHKNTCIFGNVNNEIFVDVLTKQLIASNRTQPVNYFTFPDSIRYLNADSMQFDMSRLNLIFQNECKGHQRRLMKK